MNATTRISGDRTGQLIALASVAAIAVSMVFLNRWVVTDLGVKSFGRVWHYYINYFEFGFSRRALVGTVLSALGLNRLFANELVFGYVAHAASIIAMTALIGHYLIRYRPFEARVAYIVVLFSPALILQAAYLTGTQDCLLLIAAIFIIMYGPSRVTIVLVSVASVLVHELFVFMLPFLFLMIYLGQPVVPGTGRPIVRTALLFIPVMLVTLVLAMFGTIDMQRDLYEAKMASKMPFIAFDRNLPGWSGYFEVSSSTEDNIAVGMRYLFQVLDNIQFLFLPILYCLLVAIGASFFATGVSPLLRVFLFAAILFPLLVALLASDFYRWVGLVANLGILAMMRLSVDGISRIPSWFFYMLLPFSLLAPFGSAGLERPFPALQLILERTLG